MTTGPAHRSEAAERLWGVGDLDAAFTGSVRVVPWPSAPRRKHQPLVARHDLERLIAGPPALADLDPRDMYATQTFCVAGHVAYYLTPEWHRTGRTSADQGKAHNRYPLVWTDHDGRNIILGGHHRSLAALLQGRPVRCRILRPADDHAVAVLPLLLAGPSTTLPHHATDDPEEAAGHITADHTVLVPDLDVAKCTLVTAGLDDAVIDDRIAMARTGCCRQSM